MTKDELKIFLDEITTYYGLDKIISPKRLELWAGFVDYIPSTALRFIASQIYKNSDTMPRNIPKHMQRWFYEWKRINSISQHYEQTECPDCRSTGLIWYYETIDNFKYTKVAVCALCDNWRLNMGEKTKSRYPTYTVRDLEERGIDFLDLRKMAGKASYTGTVRDKAQQVANNSKVPF
jgi:hypothetical protein